MLQALLAKIAVVGIIALVSFGGGFFTEWHLRNLENAAATAKSETKVVNTTIQQDKATEQDSQQAAQVITQIRTVTKTIVKKVPVYVTKAADSKCVVPVGFVRLHDAAASGVSPIPGTSGESNDAASGIGLSDVASTVTDNYGKYHELVEQVTQLQSWIRQQQGIMNNDLDH